MTPWCPSRFGETGRRLGSPINLHLDGLDGNDFLALIKGEGTEPPKPRPL